MNVTAGVSSDAQHGTRRPRRELGTEGVVDVNDGRARSEIREEARLRFGVGVHRSVKIEVVLSEVREGGDGERHGVDTHLGEGVARHFHHEMRRATVGGARRIPRVLVRLGSRERLVHGVSSGAPGAEPGRRRACGF